MGDSFWMSVKDTRRSAKSKRYLREVPQLAARLQS
jgi:hypothetical protein